MKLYSISVPNRTRAAGFETFWFLTKKEAQKALSLHYVAYPNDTVDEWEIRCSKAGIVRFLNNLTGPI